MIKRLGTAAERQKVHWIKIFTLARAEGHKRSALPSIVLARPLTRGYPVTSRENSRPFLSDHDAVVLLESNCSQTFSALDKHEL